MKNQSVLMLLLSAMLASAGFSQNAVATDATIDVKTASIAGVWQGRCGGEIGAIPCVTLTVSNETGILSGAILFHSLRKDEQNRISDTPGLPEPLFNPAFDGTTLTFEVSRRHANPPATRNDPRVRFRLTLTGADKGVINNIANPVGDGTAASGMRMLRSDH